MPQANFENKLGDVLRKAYGQKPVVEDAEPVEDPKPTGSQIDGVRELLQGSGKPEKGTAEPAETEEEEENEHQEGEREPVTVAELAAMLEWEPEAVYNVMIPHPETGEPMRLGAIKDEYVQLKEWKTDREDTESSLAEELAAAEEARQQFMRQVAEANPAELMQANAELIEAQNAYNRIDWEKLSRDHPDQAWLREKQMREAIDIKLQQRNMIQQNITATQQQIEQQNQQKREMVLKQARRALERAIPSWSKPEVFARESEELVQYAIKQGMAERSVRSIVDPAELAWMYRSMKTEKELERAKPVNAPPKALKPQAALNRSVGRAKRQQNRLTEAKNSRDMRVKTEVAAELLRGALRNG